MLGLHLQVCSNHDIPDPGLQDGAVGVTYPLHGELAGQPGAGDQQPEQVDEDEDLKHLANLLAKGLHQTSCYYRLSSFCSSIPLFP